MARKLEGGWVSGKGGLGLPSHIDKDKSLAM